MGRISGFLGYPYGMMGIPGLGEKLNASEKEDE